MKKEELIKSNDVITKEELNSLRELFIQDYSKKKGWNSNNLTTEQLLEIVSDKNYKNPGIIKG